VAHPLFADALARHQEGKLQECEALCRRILEQAPGDPDSLNLLGVVHFAKRDYAFAVRCYEALLAQNPRYAEVHNNLGSALFAQGKVDAAIRSYQTAVTLRPAYADALNNLGTAWQAAGNLNEAQRFFEAALAQQPEHAGARANLQRARYRSLPSWHFAMMNDVRRNTAYREAIRKAVRPDSLVLDIGTGSGLLAMLAAEAGAGRVVGCEAVAFVASKAEEIVRQNGYADRIRILAKRSTAIEPGEMPGKADLLVTEVFDSQILGEAVLPTLEHAHANLLKEGAAVIPCGARIFAALIEGEGLVQQLRVHEVCGLDLSAFNEFAKKEFTAMDVRPFAFSALSAHHQVFAFDFTQKSFPAESKRLEFPVIRAGTCHAVLFWFELQLDAEIVYTNSPFVPGTFTLHWGQCVQPIDKPLRLTPGQQVNAVVRHDRARISFELAS
jgi:lipopolysaccharide biosynthesis regulator YciM